MGDELEPYIQEGEIVDGTPFHDRVDAQELVDQAFQLLRHGSDAVESGWTLLALAERRRAWEVLGFASMQELVLSGLDRYKITIEQAHRQQLVIGMRLDQQKPTHEIAELIGVHPATVARDLTKAREAGMLDEEPERLPARDGVARPTTIPTQGGAPRARRRQDLRKSWRFGIDDLSRRMRSLASMRQDERYRNRLADLSDTVGEIRQAHALLTQIIQDFDAVNSSGEN